MIWQKLTDTYEDEKTSTIKEFKRRFLNSFLKVEYGSKIQYLEYKDFYGDSFVFKSYENPEQILIPYYTDEINITIPTIKKGFHSLGPYYLVYVVNTAKRQWIRGVSGYNYSIFNFSNHLKSILNLQLQDEDYLTINSNKSLHLLLKNQENIHNNTKDIFNTELYTLIDNNFVLIKNSDTFDLFFHKFKLGYFIKPTEFILTDTLFNQELQEAKVNWNFNFKISNNARTNT